MYLYPLSLLYLLTFWLGMYLFTYKPVFLIQKKQTPAVTGLPGGGGMFQVYSCSFLTVFCLYPVTLFYLICIPEWYSCLIASFNMQIILNHTFSAFFILVSFSFYKPYTFHNYCGNHTPLYSYKISEVNYSLLYTLFIIY